MRDLLQDRLRLTSDNLEALNAVLLNPGSQVIGDLLDTVLKYGTPEQINRRARPSQIQDYYRLKEEIIASGEWEQITLNFQDKFEALNRTAWALTEHGLSFVAAGNLHA